MKDAWATIDAWLREHSPQALASLQPGASPEAIDALERQVGSALPAELREHLSIHDGQRADSLLGLLDGWIFLGCESIADAHGTFTDLLHSGDFAGQETENRDGAVKPVWWSPHWIPFLEGPGGDYLCFDLDPAEGGTVGQIITFWHADGDRDVRAESLEQLLAQFIEDLRDDAYKVSRKGGLWPR